jgi:hypothetical protein
LNVTSTPINFKIPRKSLFSFMAFQFVQGQLLQPAPQLENIVATRPATESTPQSTSDAAAASSPDIPEGTEDLTIHLPTNPPNSPSSASDEDAGSPPSSSEEADLPNASLPPLPIGEQMDEGMRHACHTYRKHQKAFEANICGIGVLASDRAEFQSLLGDQGATIAHHNYERAAQLIPRAHGLPPNKRMMGVLFRIIRGREVVQTWHLRLHADDARHAKDTHHQDMIDVLKRTYEILTGGQAYVKKAVFKRKGRGKRQAAQRQLPVPATPRQLPLPVSQPMRLDDSGEQRSRTPP